MQLLAQSSSDPSGAVTAAIAAMGGVIIVIGMAFAAFTLLVYFLIVKRTGYSPWLSLLMLVPVANLIVLIILAFTEWPIERELKALRARAGAAAIDDAGTIPSTSITPT